MPISLETPQQPGPYLHLDVLKMNFGFQLNLRYDDDLFSNI